MAACHSDARRLGCARRAARRAAAATWREAAAARVREERATPARITDSDVRTSASLARHHGRLHGSAGRVARCLPACSFWEVSDETSATRRRRRVHAFPGGGLRERPRRGDHHAGRHCGGASWRLRGAHVWPSGTVGRPPDFSGSQPRRARRAPRRRRNRGSHGRQPRACARGAGPGGAVGRGARPPSACPCSRGARHGCSRAARTRTRLLETRSPSLSAAARGAGARFGRNWGGGGVARPSALPTQPARYRASRTYTADVAAGALGGAGSARTLSLRWVALEGEGGCPIWGELAPAALAGERI